MGGGGGGRNFSSKKEFRGACGNPGIIKGLGSHGRGSVKITAVDSVFPESTLANRYQSGRVCSKLKRGADKPLLGHSQWAHWFCLGGDRVGRELRTSGIVEHRLAASVDASNSPLTVPSVASNHTALPASPQSPSFMPPQTGRCLDIYKELVTGFP